MGKWLAAEHHIAEVIDIVDVIQRHELAADIAQSRGFSWACDNRYAAGVSTKLVKEMVLAATANNMQCIERAIAQIGQFTQGVCVEQRQAVKNAARQLSIIFRNCLVVSRQAA